MTTIFENIDNYRHEFLHTLKQNKQHFDTELISYSTPSNKYNINYFKWKHPYQGNWEYTEIFTDNILNGLCDFINKDSIVIDVGAQAGLMSIGFAQLAKKVISFEPNPATFEVLEKNSKIHSNIIPYNFACSTTEGILEFHYSDEGFCNGGFATGCSQGIGVTGHIIPMDVYAINLLEFLNKYHTDDVGAQAGLMSIGFAQLAKKVISFEPNPATFEVLEKNSKIHSNIIPYNFACSTTEGILEFHYSDEGFCNGGFATGCSQGIGVTGHIIPMDVYAINLLEFLNKYHTDDIKNISLIKIDAEGHDNMIINTITSLIETVRPAIITEMYSGLNTSEASALLNTLKNLNYKIYNIGNINEGLESPLKRNEIFSINDLKIGNHGNLLCLPR